MNKTQLNQKTFEDSNICLNEESKNATSQEKEMVINCFYKCPFKASESSLMEKHYRKEHYQKEVFHG